LQKNIIFNKIPLRIKSYLDKTLPISSISTFLGPNQCPNDLLSLFECIGKGNKHSFLVSQDAGHRYINVHGRRFRVCFYEAQALHEMYPLLL